MKKLKSKELMVSGEKTGSYFVLEKKTPFKNELTQSLTELVTQYKLSKKAKYKSNLRRECVRNFTWSEIWLSCALFGINNITVKLLRLVEGR